MDSLKSRADRVHQFLVRHFGSGAAASFFRDAAHLLDDSPSPLKTSAHLASHAMREAESAVREALWGMVSQSPDEKDERGRPKLSKRDKMRAILDYLGVARPGVEDFWDKWDQHTNEAPRHAHRDGLRGPRKIDDEVHRRWAELVDILELLMKHFEARYPDVFTRLDELLQVEKPSKNQLQWLRRACPPTLAARTYFFGRLQSASWLDALTRRGFFTTPPPPVKDDQGRISLPQWPEGLYLATVAADLPHEVASILAEVNTDNVRVQEQILDIAAALPPAEALRISPQAELWINELLSFRWSESGFVALAATLANSKHATVALRLVEVLLDASAARSDEEGVTVFYDRESVPPGFAKDGSALLQVLATALGLDALDVVATALDARLTGTRRTEVSDRDPSDSSLGHADFSTVWLPDLSSGPAPSGRDGMRPFLAEALGVMLNAAHRAGASVATIDQLLARRNGRVFRRLALRFAVLHFPESRALATRLLLAAKPMLDDVEVWAEYGELLQRVFPELDVGDQTVILEAIRTPEMEDTEAADEYSRIREEFERNWLGMIAADLPAEYSRRLEELVARLGPAESPLVDRRLPPVIEEGEILVAPDLEAIAVDRIPALLDQVKDPLVPASSSALAQAVSARPVEFAAGARGFSPLRAAFLSAFCDGLRSAVRASAVVDWSGVLELVCESLSAGEIATEKEAEVAFRSAMSLVIEGIRSPLRTSMGPVAWRAISRVFEKAAPDERQFDSDPTTRSLNSARPLAVDAALEIALWATKAGDVPLAEQALQSVRDEITRSDSTLARAVIGRFLPRLIEAFPTWTEVSLETLFRSDPGDVPTRAVTFDAYLRWTRPYVGVLPLLEDEYRTAIGRLSTEGAQGNGEGRDGLGKHLVQLYGWGAIGLESESLIVDFFDRAPPERRAAALHYIGWSLVNAEDPPDDAFMRRWQDLWDWLEAHVEMTPDELVEFGWWFSSRTFPESWALVRLRDVLTRVGMVEWDHATAEYLSDLASTRVAEVLAVISGFDPTGGGEPWRVSYWLDQAESIFRVALESPDEGVRARARAEVGRWVAHDHLRLLRLLGTNGGGAP